MHTIYITFLNLILLTQELSQDNHSLRSKLDAVVAEYSVVRKELRHDIDCLERQLEKTLQTPSPKVSHDHLYVDLQEFETEINNVSLTTIKQVYQSNLQAV